MAICFAYVVLVLALVVRVLSQAPATFFINPPAAGDELFFLEDAVYDIDSTVAVQWVTNLTAYNVFLWQQSLNVGSAAEGSDPVYTKIAGSDEEGGFTWTVSVAQFQLEQSNVFFFALTPAGSVSLDGASTSHYFNVTASTDSASTTSSSSPASTPTSTAGIGSPTTPTLPSSPPPSTPTPSSPLSPQSKQSSSPSSSSAIGIGVGLGLGIPLLLLILYLLIPKRYLKKAFMRKPPSYANSIDQDNPFAINIGPIKSVVGEMPGNEPTSLTLAQGRRNVSSVAELDGSQGRRSRMGTTRWSGHS